MKASIGVKRMGELQLNPFIAAAKKKYTAIEAENTALDIICVIEGKLRNPNWYSFKGIMVGVERKVSILVM